MSRAHPEHELQILIHKAVRAHVPMPHWWFCVDRSQKSSQFTHVREKARGLKPGTPDSFLFFPGKPAIAIELKAKGNRVDEGSAQEHVGIAIGNSGHLWGWTDTVEGYFRLLIGFGVTLQGNWQLTAANYDALLESAAIRREEGKTGKPSKRRFAPKPSASKVKAMERVRSGILC